MVGIYPNIYVLVAPRTVQAAGGAGFTPSATGIVVDCFSDERDRAVSLFGSIYTVSATINPMLGDLFVPYLSWRWIFLVDASIGDMIVVLALRHIPPEAICTKRDHSHANVVGMALLGVSLFAGMFAVSDLGERGERVLTPKFLEPVVIATAAL